MMGMIQQTEAGNKVLICPLNWGLGHATRCIPVIRAFQEADFDVMVGSNGRALDFLKEYLGSSVSYCHIPGIVITYPKRGGIFPGLLWQFPGFLFAIWKEHHALKRVISQTGVGLVISDNRYGLFSKKAKTVFITHQLFIRAPAGLRWVEPLVFALNHFFIRRFDKCWVPDSDGPVNLSGMLAHKRPLKHVTFVGPLSRFAAIDQEDEKNPLPADFPAGFVLALISGPEPQRSIFEEKLEAQCLINGRPVVFVRGLPGDSAKKKPSRQWFNQLPVQQLAFLIRRAQLVVCRSGYSSMMDLAVYGKKALLIPTPGQTEQEYLAAMMCEKGWVHAVSQRDMLIDRDLPLAVAGKGIPVCSKMGPDIQALLYGR